MFHDIGGWQALVVGGTTFIFGMNGYILRQYSNMFEGNLGGGVSLATVAGCALGGFLGEIIAELIYSPKNVGGSFPNRGQVLLKRAGFTALAAALGSGFLGLLLFYIAPNVASNEIAIAALGALSAVMTSGRFGFDP